MEKYGQAICVFTGKKIVDDVGLFSLYLTQVEKNHAYVILFSSCALFTLGKKKTKLCFLQVLLSRIAHQESSCIG